MSRRLLASMTLVCMMASTWPGAHGDPSARAPIATNCAQCVMARGRGTPGLAPSLLERVARRTRRPGGWPYRYQAVTVELSGSTDPDGAHHDSYRRSFAERSVAERATISNFINLSAPEVASEPIALIESVHFTHRGRPDFALRQERLAFWAKSPSSLPGAARSPPRRPGQLALGVRWRGARLAYARNCAGCHLLSGAGIPNQVPRLRGFVGYFMRSRAGRAYLVRLPDIAYSALSNAELARLLNWVVRRFSAAQLPARFKPYTAAKVARLRADPLRDIGPVRARVLRRVFAARKRLSGGHS